MPRATQEWIGRTDDAMPPPKVRNRLYRKQGGRCAECTRELTPGNITCDHTKPLIFGGENREANLRLICTNPCSLAKSAKETSAKAKAERCLNYQMGFRETATRPMPCGRNSPWRKKVRGQVVPR